MQLGGVFFICWCPQIMVVFSASLFFLCQLCAKTSWAAWGSSCIGSQFRCLKGLLLLNLMSIWKGSSQLLRLNFHPYFFLSLLQRKKIDWSICIFVALLAGGCSRASQLWWSETTFIIKYCSWFSLLWDGISMGSWSCLRCFVRFNKPACSDLLLEDQLSKDTKNSAAWTLYVESKHRVIFQPWLPWAIQAMCKISWARRPPQKGSLQDLLFQRSPGEWLG